MKKSFIIPLLAMLMCMVACNDTDSLTKNDAAYTAMLAGSWRLDYSAANVTYAETYRFYGDQFSYSYHSMETTPGNPETATLPSIKEQSINYIGTWNVYKGVLQTKVNLDSFNSLGYSDTEIAIMKDKLDKLNILLAEANKKKQPVGPSISFETVGTNTMLKIAGKNGLFVRTGY